MSTLVQVKEEQTGDVYCVETDSESDECIDVDYLQTLGPKLALLSTYPVGCKVLCNLRRLSASSHLQAKIGTVTEVYIHFENGRRVYKVKTCAPTENEIIVYEEKLAYAINCPVKVSNADADGTRNGIVVYLERGRGSDGKQQVTYAVQFEEGDYITIKSGVDAKHIKYGAQDRDLGASRNNGDMNPLGEDGEVDGDKTTHPSSIEPSTQVESIDCRASLETDRWTPPSPLQRKRGYELEESPVNQRPNKVFKREEVKREASKGPAERNGGECILNIPSWWTRQWGKENRNRFFVHLIGERPFKGHKTKNIESETGCSIHITGHNSDDAQMRIRIVSRKPSKCNLWESVGKAIFMIKKSLVEFLADKNSERRLLYELATTARGSLCRILFKQDASSGLLLLKSHGGCKSWSRLLELPCYEQGNCCHGSFLNELKLNGLESSDCKVEVFERSEKVPLASPYVYVSGSKQKEVKSATLMVVDAMRKHQRLCPCRPKW